MATQEEIDAAVAALQDDENGLDAAVQRIEAEIANLQSQGVNADALVAEVANLKGHVDIVSAIAPEATP